MKQPFYRLCATVLVCCMAVSACGGGDSGSHPVAVTPAPAPPAPEQAIAFSRMDPQGPSSLKTSRAVVISDTAAWQVLWREHSAGMVVVPAVPMIDFAKQSVAVGVIAGCAEVSVSQVVKTASALQVRYKTLLTGGSPAAMPNCRASAVSAPFFVTFARQTLPVEFADATGPTIAYTRIDAPFNPAPDQTVLITDKATWEALWKTGTADAAPPPPVPSIDFATQNVAMIRRFGTNGCFALNTFQMLRTASAVQLQYRAASDHPPRTSCTASMSYQVALLVFAKQDLPVEFINVDGVGVDSSAAIDSGPSAILTDRNAVVTDPTAWQALWNEHTANVANKPALPTIDFATTSVVALFRRVPDACSGPIIKRTVELADATQVRYLSDRPRSGDSCMAGPLTMTAFEVIKKTALKIEFMNVTPTGS